VVGESIIAQLQARYQQLISVSPQKNPGPLFDKSLSPSPSFPPPFLTCIAHQILKELHVALRV